MGTLGSLICSRIERTFFGRMRLNLILFFVGYVLILGSRFYFFDVVFFGWWNRMRMVFLEECWEGSMRCYIYRVFSYCLVRSECLKYGSRSRVKERNMDL